jgi:RHS repeat-associated protein
LTNTWFAGQLLSPEDRVQSRGKYFPFGEDRTAPSPANPPNDQEKFATYTRDSATLLDYAYQRYYNYQLGRFQTPDPYTVAASSVLPQSWNRYAYVQNDPINAIDPGGLFLIAPFIGEGGGGGCFDPIDGGSIYEDGSDFGDGFAPGDPGIPGWGGFGPCIFLSPYFPSDPGVGGGGSQPAPSPECFAQLKDRPVNDPAAAKFHAVHTFWWVQASDGSRDIISGGPSGGYLDVWVVPGNVNGPDTANAATAWDSGLSSAICAAVSQMLAAASAFANGSITYSPYPGPNSNTAAHLLATAGGLQGVTPPLTAYGWNASLLSPPHPAPPPAPAPVPTPAPTPAPTPTPVPPRPRPPIIQRFAQ